ncbi:MAG: lipoyl synthase [Chromatiales bacterium]|nr:lipoyl synthase [Chromatiales bacterium]
MAPTIKNKTIPIQPVFDHSALPNVSRMPDWIRQSLAQDDYAATAGHVHNNRLNTVCESAQCPNRGECWSSGTATFMLLGDICTRACGFCAVTTGRPLPVDLDEPRRIAKAAEQMGVKYLVLTSVNRDELEDGGAAIFAETLKQLYQMDAELGLELLTPDFRGCQEGAVEQLAQALPESKRWVWGHNVETVPSLYQQVRKGSRYQRSLELLEQASRLSNVETKSSLMLGLGESTDEVLEVLSDLRNMGVTRLALGQYLRPSRHHLPVREYLTPEQFEQYAVDAKAMGFTWVKSGAMVRSSYHAEELL